MRREVLDNELENNQVFQGPEPENHAVKPTGFPAGLPVGLMAGKDELSERDHSIMVGLGQYPVLTARQISVLAGFTNIDRAQRRCLALHRKGLLGRMPYFSLTPGRAEFCYFLSNKGHQYLHLKSMDEEASRVSRIKNGMFLNHLLLITQFWLSLQLGCRNHSLVRLDGFIPEFGHRNEKGKKPTTVKVLSPDPDEEFTLVSDAAFCMAGQSRKRLFFLEIDRANGKVQSASYRSFTSQVQKYIWYMQGKSFGDYGKVFGYEFPNFQVVYVTTSETRIRTYQQALAALGDFQKFVLFTTFEKVTPETVLGKIWHPSRAEDGNLCSLVE